MSSPQTDRWLVGRTLTFRTIALAWLVVVGSCTLCVNRSANAQVDGPVIAALSDTDEDDGPIVSDSGVGYIDNAILGNQFRLRFDAAFNNVQPARAEFFWAVGGKFGPGPGPETSVNYQDFAAYLELQPLPNWSAFVEIPFRIIDPEIQSNTGGLGDSNAGVKYALGQTCDSATTAQLRVYAPTGDAHRGLGNNHVSLEPALLHYRQVNDRLSVYGELRDWIGIEGSPTFTGNVLRYGLGAAMRLNEPDACRGLALVTEFVGWTVLDGRTAITRPTGGTIAPSAVGDTIVNAKVGLRWQLSCVTDVYVGYGVALTEQTWYDDVLRLELRRRF